MKIPSSWQLDNCVTAGEMRPPVSVYLLLLGAFSYCSPLLSVALLGFSEAKKFSDFLFNFFFPLINLWMKNPFATEAN